MYLDPTTLYVILFALAGVCLAPIINPLLDLVGDVIGGVIHFIIRPN